MCAALRICAPRHPYDVPHPFSSLPCVLQVERNGHSVFDWVIGQLTLPGYQTETKTLTPTDFGVSQQRHRMFIVGDTQGPSGFQWPQ
ncbi:MAG: hypothetical protein F4Y87_03535 [Synechococcus sp. SB0665_bin_28]|nr:hypothetical protein [Synechococcus sp. SB0665_bin_28]MYF21012.1 hypothetical protein [Synechococcus sp. SB0677_bin_5]